MKFKRAVAVLLACSILIPFISNQIVPAQTNTTTSTQSSTTNLTTAMVSISQQNVTLTQPIRYLVTPYQYDYQTGRFVIWQTEDTSGSGGGDYSCLYFEYFLFNATGSQVIRGHYELLMTGRSIYFLILNLDQFRRFSQSYCLYGWDGAAELHVYAPAYDLDWSVPQTGEYAFVFFTTIFYGGYIQFKTQSYTTTFSNSTITYTTTTPYTQQSAKTETYTTTPIATQTQTETPNYFLLLIGLIAAATIIVALKIKRRTPPQDHQNPPTADEPRTMIR